LPQPLRTLASLPSRGPPAHNPQPPGLTTPRPATTDAGQAPQLKVTPKPPPGIVVELLPPTTCSSTCACTHVLSRHSRSLSSDSWVRPWSLGHPLPLFAMSCPFCCHWSLAVRLHPSLHCCRARSYPYPPAQVPVLVPTYSVDTLGRCRLTLGCGMVLGSSSTTVRYVSCPFCCRYPLWSLAVRLHPRCFVSIPMLQCLYPCPLPYLWPLLFRRPLYAVCCVFMYCQQPLGRCSADMYMTRSMQQQRPLRCNCFVAPKGRPAFSTWEAPLRCPSWPTLTTLSS
jgi:hypothetical protein